MKLERKTLVNLGFLVPSLLIFGLSVVLPFFMGLNIAFTNWDGIAPHYKYIGLKNFILLFSDENVLLPIKNTFFYAICITTINNFISVLLAISLHSFVKRKNFFKLIFFIPTALSTILAAFIWGFIYRDVFPNLLGINSLLGNPTTVIPGVMIIALWNTLGSNIIIYMAAINNVPEVYYEAAIIDGANSVQKFRNITLPMIVPAFTVCITLTFTSALREFGTVMAATGGGPARSSETISIFIYRNLFSFYRASYGQAVSLIFMIILIITGWAISRTLRKREVEI